MQYERALALQKAWEAKGNPPCDHPEVDREYYLGMNTGDVVCTTCGESGPRGKLQNRTKTIE